jgi:hypothetical protein
MVPPAWPSLIEGPIVIDTPLGAPERENPDWVAWPN